MRKEEKESALKTLRPLYDEDVHFKPNSYGEELAVFAMIKFSQESNKELLSKIEELEKDRDKWKETHEFRYNEFVKVMQQLQQSQQMNERLVIFLTGLQRTLFDYETDYIKTETVHIIAKDIKALLQSTNQSQEKGEINFHCGCQPLETCKGLSNCRRCTHPFK